jgi:hypothetical protein
MQSRAAAIAVPDQELVALDGVPEFAFEGNATHLVRITTAFDAMTPPCPCTSAT